MTEEHDPQAFLQRVQALAGASHAADAERMTRAVLSTLLEELPAAERGPVLSVLPAALRTLPAPGVVRQSETLHAFYERVGSREGVALGSAVEHAQCVCRALSESLSHEARHKLVSRLPDALGSLLTLSEGAPVAPPSAPRHTPEAAHTPPAAHTLAAGKAGSRKPVAESAPPGAHASSVARSDDPHSDTKLSTSHGATQEREDETLAGGRPGSGRPLGEGGTR